MTAQAHTYTLPEFSLQLVTTLDYNRLLLQNNDGTFEVWQASMVGILVVGGVKYEFLNDLIADPTLN
jgi:hypothetical protein